MGHIQTHTPLHTVHHSMLDLVMPLIDWQHCGYRRGPAGLVLRHVVDAADLSGNDSIPSRDRPSVVLYTVNNGSPLCSAPHTNTRTSLYTSTAMTDKMQSRKTLLEAKCGTTPYTLHTTNNFVLTVWPIWHETSVRVAEKELGVNRVLPWWLLNEHWQKTDRQTNKTCRNMFKNPSQHSLSPFLRTDSADIWLALVLLSISVFFCFSIFIPFLVFSAPCAGLSWQSVSHWAPVNIPYYTVVERRSLASELSLSCARPAADGWPLLWVSHPLYVSQLGQLSLSSFRGR